VSGKLKFLDSQLTLEMNFPFPDSNGAIGTFLIDATMKEWLFPTPIFPIIKIGPAKCDKEVDATCIDDEMARFYVKAEMNLGLPEVAVKISGSFKLADPFLIQTWGPIEVDNVDVLIGQDGFHVKIEGVPFPVIPSSYLTGVTLPAIGSADMEFNSDTSSGDIVVNGSYKCGFATMVENSGEPKGLRDLPKNVLTSLGPIVKDKVIKGIEESTKLVGKLQSELKKFDDAKEDVQKQLHNICGALGPFKGACKDMTSETVKGFDQAVDRAKSGLKGLESEIEKVPKLILNKLDLEELANLSDSDKIDGLIKFLDKIFTIEELSFRFELGMFTGDILVAFRFAAEVSLPRLGSASVDFGFSANMTMAPLADVAKAIFDKVFPKLINFAKAVYEKAQAFVNQATAAVQEINGKVEDVIGEIQGVADGLKGGVEDAIKFATKSAEDAVEHSKAIVSGIKDLAGAAMDRIKSLSKKTRRRRISVEQRKWKETEIVMANVAQTLQEQIVPNMQAQDMAFEAEICAGVALFCSKEKKKAADSDSALRQSGLAIGSGGTDSAHVDILDALRMCLAFDNRQSTASRTEDCNYCPHNSDNLPGAMMSMSTISAKGESTDTTFRDSGVGVYSGLPECAESSCESPKGKTPIHDWCADSSCKSTIVNFDSPNFKKTVNDKTPKAYVEEMQKRIRVGGFSAKVCEARLTASFSARGVLLSSTERETACAGQREIPDHCGEACPENMECKYDAITTFANTCCEKGGYMCLDKNAAAKQAAATAAMKKMIMSLCSTGLLSPTKNKCCPGSCSQCGGSGCGSAGQGCCSAGDSWTGQLAWNRSTCVEPDDTKCFMPTA